MGERKIAVEKDLAAAIVTGEIEQLGGSLPAPCRAAFGQ